MLDCELLPWSAKAEELLRTQYASVGAAATATLAAERDVLGRGGAADRRCRAARRASRVTARDGVELRRRVPPLLLADRRASTASASPRSRCSRPRGSVRALDPHPWHIAVADRLAAAAPDTFRATRTIAVDLDDPASEAAAIAWWEDLTGAGGEGMVVKPVDVVVPFKRSIVQPGIKCRGPEYLRIIYGAEYTSPDQLARLRERGLGHKRSLALREFCLGIEALERFVGDEPLYRVHECVFGVLALESEPVDPRL